eukprot:998024_1
MSLTKAIHFRHLIKQLTTEECTQFLSTIFSSHVDLIMTSLFHHLAKSNQINEVNHFNESLSDIIQSRKDKPKLQCMRNRELHQFPSALIGHTASFLMKSDYVHFSMANRSIYLGCNLPSNQLQELDLQFAKIEKYALINLSSFASLKTLCVDPCKVISSQHQMSSDSQTLNKLKELHLRTLTYNQHGNHGWVEPFFSQNLVNCDHVTVLECYQFGSRENKMAKNEFLSLLERFPNLAQLRLSLVHVSNNVTAKDISNVCRKIVGLKLSQFSFRITSDLVKIFSCELKYLRLVCDNIYGSPQLDFSDVSFSKLEELKLMFPGNRLFQSILKSALNLKKISVDEWMMAGNEQIKNNVANLMVKCTSLHCMCFRVTQSDHFYSVLDGIEIGLFKTKKQPKHQMKICIEITYSQFKGNDFVLNVGRIVNALEASSINDFMLIWKSCHRVIQNDDKLNDIFKNLCQLHTSVFLADNRLIITNDNCNISGYASCVCGDVF